MVTTDIHLAFVDVLRQRLQEDSPRIQVIFGPRQVGKTTGVRQVVGQLTGPSHYASADDTLLESGTWIDEQWQVARLLGHGAVLVLDEIQKITNWSETIKRLWDAQQGSSVQLRVVVLGSSALSLHRGLTESLAGRFELIRVWQWNFAETTALTGCTLEQFLRYGGYPGSYALWDDDARFTQYVKESIVETVIHRDLLATGRVRAPGLFRQAFEVLCAYPAQEISYNKLLGQLQDRGNTDLVKHYLHLYEGAFLFRTLQKYSGKAHLRKTSSPKIIPMAPVFARLFGDAAPGIDGRIFEAVVGAELLRGPGELTYWRAGTAEVDYIYTYDGQTFAIEVKSGRKRQTAGLDKFLREYPNAVPLFITPDNYPQLCRNPAQFFAAVT